MGKRKPSHFYTGISIAIVMFLMGLFLLLILHAHNLTNLIKEKINIVVELDDSASIEDIKQKLNKLSEVKGGSIRFISKDDAIEIMKTSLNIKVDKEENPFKNVLLFNIKASKYSDKVLDDIKGKVERYDGVEQVYYESVTINALKRLVSGMAYIVLGIGIVFVIFSIILIRNMVNLSMYADRREIKTMQLSGAKSRFIKMPYIKTAIIIGLQGFFISLFLILLLLAVIYKYLPDVWDIIDYWYLLITVVVMAFLAVFIPGFTTNGAAEKYLQSEIGVMY